MNTSALVVGDSVVSLDPDDEGAVGVVTDIKHGLYSGYTWIHVRWQDGQETVCREHVIGRRAAERGAA